MKLYWPRARGTNYVSKRTDPQDHMPIFDPNNVMVCTWDSVPTYEDCIKQFQRWQETIDDMDLVEFWIEITDTRDTYYRERMDICMKTLESGEICFQEGSANGENYD